MIYPDGRTYKGSFMNNLKHGFGIYTMPNGEKHEGHWKDNKKHGKGNFTNIRGQVKTAIWNRGSILPVEMNSNNNSRTIR